jgi:hypothetical protein
MTRLRAIILAVVLGLFGLAFAAVPAHASSITRLCDPNGYCLNQWGGGQLTKAYGGDAANDYIFAIYVGNGIYELLSDVSPGGCLGDYGNNQSDARVGDNDVCPSASSNPGWGTRFQQVTSGCPSGYALYKNIHWTGLYLGFQDSNGSQAYLDTYGGRSCLRQQSG